MMSSDIFRSVRLSHVIFYDIKTIIIAYFKSSVHKTGRGQAFKTCKYVKTISTGEIVCDFTGSCASYTLINHDVKKQSMFEPLE